MMQGARRLLADLSQKMELPADLIALVPRMELTGNSEFSIEPHKGLLEYGSDQILLASSIGPVLVLGRGLRIQRMNHQRITLVGCIRSVELQEDALE